MSDLSAHELRRVVGIVPQDTALLNESIRENLRMPPAGRRTDPHPGNARRRAPRLRGLAAGWLRHGDRASHLSGGERQRLAVARALLHDPDVLILDEATSALDSTEREVYDGVLADSRNRTVLVIAHRLSTVRNADRIFVPKTDKSPKPARTTNS